MIIKTPSKTSLKTSTTPCTIAFLLLASACVFGATSHAALAAPGAAQAPAVRLPAARDLGVIYYLPDEKVSDAEVVADLARIKGEGFDHINFSSWTWTPMPKSGSEFRRRVELILNWCDANDFGFWLLYNIQYGTEEYGNLEEATKNPVEYVRPIVVDWIDTLRGHKCVRGVQLGNEIGPALPDYFNPKVDTSKMPAYMASFRTSLKARFGNIGALNAAWKTQFASFDNVEIPKENEAGRIDAQHFANWHFGHFFGTIYRGLFKPSLGESPA